LHFPQQSILSVFPYDMGGLWLSWISYFDLAVEAALIFNLLRNRLYRIYRFFFAYLTADAVETTLGMLFQSKRRVYAEIYFGGQAVKMILAVFVVLELHQIALERHAALARFWRRTVAYILAAAAALAGLAVTLDQNIPPGRPPFLHRFNTFERSMDLWMLLFLLMASLYMIWFPVRLKRNGAMYIGGFLIYFLSRSAGLLFRNLTPQWKAPIDNALLAASIVCLVVWLIALTEKGEEVTTVIRQRWGSPDAKRLTAQLDAINAKLIELSRR
ncbi:MAG: hypothetical protein LAO79_26110, partial [Acidobacteriia bacterium]|nr:hypothetical protein [Terriglobia bacterium]